MMAFIASFGFCSNSQLFRQIDTKLIKMRISTYTHTHPLLLSWVCAGPVSKDLSPTNWVTTYRRVSEWFRKPEWDSVCIVFQLRFNILVACASKHHRQGDWDLSRNGDNVLSKLKITLFSRPWLQYSSCVCRGMGFYKNKCLSWSGDILCFGTKE